MPKPITAKLNGIEYPMMTFERLPEDAPYPDDKGELGWAKGVYEVNKVYKFDRIGWALVTKLRAAGTLDVTTGSKDYRVTGLSGMNYFCKSVPLMSA